MPNADRLSGSPRGHIPHWNPSYTPYSLQYSQYSSRKLKIDDSLIELLPPNTLPLAYDRVRLFSPFWGTVVKFHVRSENGVFVGARKGTSTERMPESLLHLSISE